MGRLFPYHGQKKTNVGHRWSEKSPLWQVKLALIESKSPFWFQSSQPQNFPIPGANSSLQTPRTERSLGAATSGEWQSPAGNTIGLFYHDRFLGLPWKVVQLAFPNALDATCRNTKLFWVFETIPKLAQVGSLSHNRVEHQRCLKRRNIGALYTEGGI